MNVEFTENLIEVSRAFNTANFTIFKPLLTNDFMYTNQKDGIQVSGKHSFLCYIQDVFEVIKFDIIVFAEMGYVVNKNRVGDTEIPCVILSEWKKEHKSTLVFIEEKNGKIFQMNLFVKEDPQWINLRSTNLFPGYIKNIYVRYMHFTIRPNKINYLRLCLYANMEYAHIRESRKNRSHLREWYMRYRGLFDYVYEEVSNNSDAVLFKNNHPVFNPR